MNYCQWSDECDVAVGYVVDSHFMVHVKFVKALGEIRSAYVIASNTECLEKLLELRKLGLKVPRKATDRLRKEIRSMASKEAA